jgi:protein ImuB
MNSMQMACGYAREFPAQALLRLRPELRTKAVAIVEGEPPREFVCSANENAYAIGVQRGMSRPQMEIFDHLDVLRRSPTEEQSARAALLDCAGRFSPRVEELRFDYALGFAADITGTEKLLGPPQQIVAKLREQARALGLEISVAASCNLQAALCWTKAYPGAKVIPFGEEQNTLARIPVDVLDLTLEQSVTLSLWGIHTLGALAALPEPALVARLGQDSQRLRKLACGQYPHLLKPVEQSFELKEEVEFEAGVESLDSILFVLSPMLQQLVIRAESRALALASITVNCKLDGATRHVRTIRPVLPTIDHEALLKLIHLDLIANPPAAEVVALTVIAEPNRPSRAQLGLFSPQFPEPMRLEVTLARLAAVVGSADRVGAPELLDSNHSDAFRIANFAAPEETKKTPPSEGSRIGLRVLRPAEPVYVQTHRERPHQFVFRSEQYQVMECYGPWEGSGDWWNANLWIREQWDVVASSRSGRPLCCELTRDPVAKTWELAALYD